MRVSLDPILAPPAEPDVLVEPLVVAVTGAAGALGRRLCTRLAADPTITQLLALDRTAAPAGDRPVDLLTDDLEPLFRDVTSVVHLASAFGPALDDDPEVLAAADVVMARRVLDAAAAAGVRHVTILSSATVYGAWANNPVPLTEDSPLRPDPGLAFAVQKAEIERLAGDWREDHPDVAVAILRPALAVAEGHPGWLARSLRAAGALRAHEDDPPTQFLHLDDLAAAIDQVRIDCADGTFNVAPDGWLTPSEFRDLAGASRRLHAPRWLVDKVSALRWRFRLAPTPPGTQAYAQGSFVVANDRLRATGWEPTQTNAEAYVGAVPAGPWATVSPQRRQELALAGAGVAIVGVTVGVVALVRRRARRRA
jgi:nucleoside-diphosphate-sugar epimerase